MKLGIDLKVDFAFKRAFGAQAPIGNLRSLLEHVLRERLRGPILELTILNPIQDQETEDGKVSILDILARDRSGTLYHIEMQLLGYSDLPHRFFFYTARTYWSQLKSGENYSAIPPVISIIILDDVMFPNLQGCHHVFQMREASQGQVFCDGMEIHLIELTKFNKSLQDLADGFDQWIYLFRHAEDLDPQFPPEELSLPEVGQVLKELEIMAHTELERIQYEARQKALNDEASRRAWYLKQKDEGLQIGLQQGRIEAAKSERELWQRKAKLVKQITDRERQLSRSVSPFDELLELSEEELLKLHADLGTNNNSAEG